MYYVLVFDRSQGRLLSESEHDEPRAAMRERFASERLHRWNRNIEVVALGASSRQALRRTHSRYFKDTPALVAAVGSAVGADLPHRFSNTVGH